ncbi:MAG: PilZ domain-containing protein [Chloracidobacterium sp.]|nr:PilZ domain-containing protein [Chloracidobacterium sp.]
MLRELVARFSSTIAERRASVRRKYSVPIKVCFSPDKSPVRRAGPCEEAYLSGETCDASETGIGFEVSSIRIKERYLVGQDRLLNVELDLSGRKVRLTVRGVRYERVGIHLTNERYLIGAEIIEVNPEDQPAYTRFLKHGPMKGQATTSIIEVGVE